MLNEYQDHEKLARALAFEPDKLLSLMGESSAACLSQNIVTMEDALSMVLAQATEPLLVYQARRLLPSQSNSLGTHSHLSLR